MSEEMEKGPLKPSNALYGTGVAGMFSDSITHRYLSFLAVAAGVTVSQLSWLRAGESLSRNLLQLLWGRLVDRHGKKRFIVLGRILNGALLAMLTFVQTPTWMMPLIIGIAVCWSLVAPAWNSLQGDYTTYTTRGSVIGKIGSLSQIGGLAAMVVAFFISINQVEDTTPESFTLILATAAIMSVISGVLCLFTVEKPPGSSGSSLNFSTMLGDHRFMRYLLINVVYGASMAFAWPLTPFIIVDKLNLKVWQMAAFSLCSSGSSMMSLRYIGRLMDRIGRRPVIVFSRVSMAVAPIFYVYATSWLHIAVANIILGLGMAAWMSSGPTYVIDLAPLDMRATYLAANTAVFGVAAFAGNLAGGYVTDNFLAVEGTMQGIHAGLLISAALRFLTGLLYLKIFETYSSED
jgi:DHA1 family multidrug resistance protein-like MFS transporter